MTDSPTPPSPLEARLSRRLELRPRAAERGTWDRTGRPSPGSSRGRGRILARLGEREAGRAEHAIVSMQRADPRERRMFGVGAWSGEGVVWVDPSLLHADEDQDDQWVDGVQPAGRTRVFRGGKAVERPATRRRPRMLGHAIQRRGGRTEPAAQLLEEVTLAARGPQRAALAQQVRRVRALPPARQSGAARRALSRIGGPLGVVARVLREQETPDHRPRPAAAAAVRMAEARGEAPRQPRLMRNRAPEEAWVLPAPVASELEPEVSSDPWSERALKRSAEVGTPRAALPTPSPRPAARPQPATDAARRATEATRRVRPAGIGPPPGPEPQAPPEPGSGSTSVRARAGAQLRPRPVGRIGPVGRVVARLPAVQALEGGPAWARRALDRPPSTSVVPHPVSVPGRGGTRPTRRAPAPSVWVDPAVRDEGLDGPSADLAGTPRATRASAGPSIVDRPPPRAPSGASVRSDARPAGPGPAPAPASERPVARGVSLERSAADSRHEAEAPRPRAAVLRAAERSATPSGSVGAVAPAVPDPSRPAPGRGALGEAPALLPRGRVRVRPSIRALERSTWRPLSEPDAAVRHAGGSRRMLPGVFPAYLAPADVTPTAPGDEPPEVPPPRVSGQRRALARAELPRPEAASASPTAYVRRSPVSSTLLAPPDGASRSVSTGTGAELAGPTARRIPAGAGSVDPAPSRRSHGDRAVEAVSTGPDRDAVRAAQGAEPAVATRRNPRPAESREPDPRESGSAQVTDARPGLRRSVAVDRALARLAPELEPERLGRPAMAAAEGGRVSTRGAPGAAGEGVFLASTVEPVAAELADPAAAPSLQAREVAVPAGRAARRRRVGDTRRRQITRVIVTIRDGESVVELPVWATRGLARGETEALRSRVLRIAGRAQSRRVAARAGRAPDAVLPDPVRGEAIVEEAEAPVRVRRGVDPDGDAPPQAGARRRALSPSCFARGRAAFWPAEIDPEATAGAPARRSRGAVAAAAARTTRRVGTTLAASRSDSEGVETRGAGGPHRPRPAAERVRGALPPDQAYLMADSGGPGAEEPTGDEEGVGPRAGRAGGEMGAELETRTPRAGHEPGGEVGTAARAKEIAARMPTLSARAGGVLRALARADRPEDILRVAIEAGAPSLFPGPRQPTSEWGAAPAEPLPPSG